MNQISSISVVTLGKSDFTNQTLVWKQANIGKILLKLTQSTKISNTDHVTLTNIFEVKSASVANLCTLSQFY